jgi:hypothetical protein
MIGECCDTPLFVIVFWLHEKKSVGRAAQICTTVVGIGCAFPLLSELVRFPQMSIRGTLYGVLGDLRGR